MTFINYLQWVSFDISVTDSSSIFKLIWVKDSPWEVDEICVISPQEG